MSDSSSNIMTTDGELERDGHRVIIIGRQTSRGVMIEGRADVFTNAPTIYSHGWAERVPLLYEALHLVLPDSTGEAAD